MGSTPIPFRHLVVSRRKKKTYDASQQARRLSRAVLGTPPAERIIPGKKRKGAKHKKRALQREMD